ncbi:MAG: hypothetical protein GY749_16175 [Desulfobacteraceae bacterium]|nr:hypothetical protein [Desulfobacteraceae bacterium]
MKFVFVTRGLTLMAVILCLFGLTIPAAAYGSAAEMTYPVPGSVLASTSETFTWNDTGADQYWLWIGTSEGDYDVYSGDQGTNTSATAANLPANQETLYVRLMTKADGEWFYNDYTYTACDMTAEIQSAGDYGVYSGNLGANTSVTNDYTYTAYNENLIPLITLPGVTPSSLALDRSLPFTFES